MKIKVISFYLVSIAICLTCSGLAVAHPVDGYLPNSMPKDYGTEYFGLDESFNINELTFYNPLPDPDSLTDAEKYIVAGSTGSIFGYPLEPWCRRISQMVNAIYCNTGEMPIALTPDLIRKVSPEITVNQLEVFKSPLTGEYPQLDSLDFSTGNIYMRLLTEEEKEFFAGKLQQDHDIWFEGKMFDPRTGEYESVQVVGGIFYMRVYGLTEVLHSGIEYIFAPQQ